MRVWTTASQHDHTERSPQLHGAADTTVELLVRQLDGPLSLTGARSSDSPEAAPRLVTVGPARAALLVPAELARRVSRNGMALPPGVHVLNHTDRIDYAGRVFWLAAIQRADAVPYDPDVHSDEQHCFITKRCLVAGEMIVACPGRPGVPCQAIYQQAAWEMVLQSNPRFRCPRCRLEPGAAEWRPTPPAVPRLPHLLALARRRRREGQSS